MKKIAILTSGGDAPGMNACIRAVVRSAKYYGLDVLGIRRGYQGLLEKDYFDMGMRSVSDIIQRGGTMLYSARSSEFPTAEGKQKAADNLREQGVEGLVVIGGDGSLRGARALAVEHGIKTIGIPGTIDNDLAYTDYTLGFDTAVNTAIELVNKLRDTMTSHERVNIVEVMGRHCGDIALYVGISCGAEIVALPEKPITVQEIADRILRSRDKGKRSNVIILAEGAGDAGEMSKELAKLVPYNVRATELGHIQRGGSPTMMDRLLACQFGAYAVDLLREGKTNRVVGIRDNKIFDQDIIEALSMPRVFNEKLYEITKILSR